MRNPDSKRMINNSAPAKIIKSILIRLFIMLEHDFMKARTYNSRSMLRLEKAVGSVKNAAIYFRPSN
jgi:hypothetical protein